MKKLLLLVVLVALIVSLARFLGNRTAEARIDEASAMADDGDYRKALAKLDGVESWFSWTHASQRVEAARGKIRQLAIMRGQEDALLTESERAQRQLERAREGMPRGGDLMQKRADELRRQQEALEARNREALKAPRP